MIQERANTEKQVSFNGRNVNIFETKPKNAFKIIY